MKLSEGTEVFVSVLSRLSVPTFSDETQPLKVELLQSFGNLTFFLMWRLIRNFELNVNKSITYLIIKLPNQTGKTKYTHPYTIQSHVIIRKNNVPIEILIPEIVRVLSLKKWCYRKKYTQKLEFLYVMQNSMLFH